MYEDDYRFMGANPMMQLPQWQPMGEQQSPDASPFINALMKKRMGGKGRGLPSTSGATGIEAMSGSIPTASPASGAGGMKSL